MLDDAKCPMCQSTNRTINGLSTPEFWCCLDCGHLFGALVPADRAPKCPYCKSNRAVEESIYRDEGTHFCTHCERWFGRKKKPHDEQKKEVA